MCARVYLDVDGDGAVSPGDAVTAGAPVQVTMYQGTLSQAQLELSALQPGAGAGSGSLSVTVSCTGPTCGSSGTLVLEALRCADSTVIRSTQLTAQTLTMGTPLMLVMDSLAVGGVCARVYLDVDGNGAISAGDAITGAASVQVDIFAGTMANVAQELTVLQ